MAQLSSTGRTTLGRLDQAQARGTLRQIANASRHFAQISTRLAPAGTGRLARASDRVDGLNRLLDGLSYKSAIRRGFALVRNADGNMVARGEKLKAGETVSIEWADGLRGAIMQGGMGAAAQSPAPKAGKKAASKTEAANQGDLF